MTQERNLLAVFYRKNRPYKAISYGKVDNAIAKMNWHLMHVGAVGDVVELSHKVSGRQLGTVKLTAKGNLRSQWVWEN